MTSSNLRKIIFMLFEEGLMAEVKKLHSDYRYIINDGSLEIIRLVANAYTAQNETDFFKTINELSKLSPTEEFPNIQALIGKLCVDAKESGTIKGIPKQHIFNNEIFYKSPGLKFLSINGTQYEDTLNLEALLRKHIRDKVVFRENIEKHKDPWYKNHIKLIHAIETLDIDYGLEAGEYFLKQPVPSEGKMAPYLILIELLEAKQRTNPGSKIHETKEYKALETILKDTKYSLNLAYIKHWTIEKIDFYKAISEIKKHLAEIGFDKAELDNYSQGFLRF